MSGFVRKTSMTSRVAIVVQLLVTALVLLLLAKLPGKLLRSMERENGKSNKEIEQIAAHAVLQ